MINTMMLKLVVLQLSREELCAVVAACSTCATQLDLDAVESATLLEICAKIRAAITADLVDTMKAVEIFPSDKIN
jgi:hypothetical protein